MRSYINLWKTTILIGLLGTTGVTWGSGAIQDAESATHGFEAAQYYVVDTYEFPGFQLIQIDLPVLSHYSYLVVSDGRALMVDPGRDAQFYLDLIESQKLQVVGLYLTHSHADFVAGHMEMVKALKCPIYQSAKSNAKYAIQTVTDGSLIKVGLVTVKSMDTPGHVIDGTSGLVYSPESDTPAVMLSGDYLFVGSVGRPDLVMGTTSATLAGLIYDTWINKVSKLPDSVQVFPAHGAGSLCGAHLRDAPFTTIGEERVSNPYLQPSSKAAFVTEILASLSEPPQYFGHNAAMNQAGPPLVNWQQPLAFVTADAALIDKTQNYIVDIRTAEDFAAGHIPNSVNIGLRGRFETWVGIMVPWGSNVVLCGEEPDLTEAVTRLHRVGYTARVIPLSHWQSAGLPLRNNKRMAPADLYAAMQTDTAPVVVDVRLPNEWMGLRIGTVLNLPLNKLTELSRKLNPSDPAVAVCNSAYRSSLAIGILEREGFTQVSSLEGGAAAWQEAGYPVYGAETHAGTTATARKVIPLPERIDAAELKRLLMDLPETFDLLDIRPPTHFVDYHLPGSVNVEIAELVNNPAYLTGAGPLIVVDRDGSLAMAVAGILSQKTQRPIKALYGGLEAYWSAHGLFTAPAPMDTPHITPRAAPPRGPAPSAPVKPTPSKKKSAGC
ncbi:rhodanese-like domain-containing protein [Planctomycetota bacterium]